jgi:predicted metal-dependent hydrolase
VAKTTRVRLKRAPVRPQIADALRSALRREQGVSVAGLDAPVHVRRHPAARRLTLRVSQVRREVALTIPQGSNLSEASQFVAEHMDWVRERLEALPELVTVRPNSTILFRGYCHRVVSLGPTRHQRIAWVEGTRAARAALREAEAEASARRKSKISLPEQLLPRICVTGHEEHVARRLRDWLIDRARKELSERVAHHAQNLGLRPRRVIVRDQTSRWGSCSSARVLSFSWRLILAPAYVLDYVAAHEVAHLKEMNHGPRFWDLVKRTMPRVDEARRWLRRNGAELHSYAFPV